jgi:hypothetical protein
MFVGIAPQRLSRGFQNVDVLTAYAKTTTLAVERAEDEAQITAFSHHELVMKDVIRWWHRMLIGYFDLNAKTDVLATVAVDDGSSKMPRT